MLVLMDIHIQMVWGEIVCLIIRGILWKCDLVIRLISWALRQDYSHQNCFWYFILPNLVLISCHLRFAKSFEKTWLSGNSIMTFLSNFTVTESKYVAFQFCLIKN